MLLALFAQMWSGRGFLNDLSPTPDITAKIGQPTLVIATRSDRGVPFAHAQSLADTIRHVEFVPAGCASCHALTTSGRNRPPSVPKTTSYLTFGWRAS